METWKLLECCEICEKGIDDKELTYSIACKDCRRRLERAVNRIVILVIFIAILTLVGLII